MQLTDPARAELAALLKTGGTVQVFRPATGLLELDRGQTLQAVATTLGVAYNRVAAGRDPSHEHGFQCLSEAPRAGRPREIDGGQRARVTALACSDAPAGQTRWRLPFLAAQAVELNYCDHLSPSYAGVLLKKRTPTAFETDLVQRANQRPIHSLAGASLVVGCPAL